MSVKDLPSLQFYMAISPFIPLSLSLPLPSLLSLSHTFTHSHILTHIPSLPLSLSLPLKVFSYLTLSMVITSISTYKGFDIFVPFPNSLDLHEIDGRQFCLCSRLMIRDLQDALLGSKFMSSCMALFMAWRLRSGRKSLLHSSTDLNYCHESS